MEPSYLLATLTMTAYPDNLIRRHRMADGTELTIRPIRPDDTLREQAFVRSLSESGRYFRFMQNIRELPPRMAHYLTAVDYDGQLALFATVASDQEEVVVGAARYAVNPDGLSAEFAVAVADAWQRRGIASLLIGTLCTAARDHGLRTLEGFVLRTNHNMLGLARKLGFTVHAIPGDSEDVRIVKAIS